MKTTLFYLSLLTLLFSACKEEDPHPLTHDATINIDVTSGTNLDYVDLHILRGSSYEQLGSMQMAGNVSDLQSYSFIAEDAVTEHPSSVRIKAVYHQFNTTSPSDIEALLKLTVEGESSQVIGNNLGHLSEQIVVLEVE